MRNFNTSSHQILLIWWNRGRWDWWGVWKVWIKINACRVLNGGPEILGGFRWAQVWGGGGDVEWIDMAEDWGQVADIYEKGSEALGSAKAGDFWTNFFWISSKDIPSYKFSVMWDHQGLSCIRLDQGKLPVGITARDRNCQIFLFRFRHSSPPPPFFADTSQVRSILRVRGVRSSVLKLVRCRCSDSMCPWSYWQDVWTKLALH